jgi:YggT family protein
MSLGLLIYQILSLYVYVLIARIIIDYVMMFSRSWQPRGFVLALVDVVFRLTDPPLRFLRRFIPPLRLGSVSLDLSFLVLIIGVQVISGLALRLL